MKKKTSAAEDSYVRVPGYAELLAGVHLPAEVWAVFAQCDTPRRPAEIARRARLGEDVVLSSLRRLSRRRLVQKHELDWQAYLATQAPQSAPEAPAGAAQSAPPAPVAIPEPAPVFAAAPTPAPAPIPDYVTQPPFAPPRLPSLAHEPVSFSMSNSAASEARLRSSRDVLSLHIGRDQPERAGVLAA